MRKKLGLTIIAASLLFLNIHSQERPNIIWLMAEDISNDLECYGTKGVQTPIMNKLAEDGIIFTNCFSSNPICSPNRSAMMTGVHQNKINAHHHRSNRKIPLPDPYKPFTYWLRKAGYTCILGNKNVMNNGRKTDCNFKHSPVGSYDGVTQFGLFDKFDEFSKEDQPFFSQIQLVVTHRGDWWDKVRDESPKPVKVDEIELPPYLADDPVVRLDWAKYLDQIEYMDREIGVIVEELKAKGMYDNTIIIFIGDNGRCNIKGKGYLYDPGLRVPLIVHWPKKLKAQKRDDLVSTVDITATILDFAGAEMPDYLTGQSFMDDDFEHKYIYSTRDLWDELLEKSRSLTGKRYKYIRNDIYEKPYDRYQAYLEFYRPALHIMRRLKSEGKLKKEEALFFAIDKPAEELYDLKNDPYELENLAGDPEYQALLLEMRQDCYRIEQEMKSDEEALEIVHPISTDILEWFKYTKPQEYLKMLEGIEPGFQRLAGEYRKSLK